MPRGARADDGTAAQVRGGEPAVLMSGIRKSFGGVPVLRGVDFDLARGEVHALAGGNGAGKSTLMKVLQGVHPADEGTIAVDGRRVEISSIHDARAAGIGMVFQEFSLVPSLTVAQNIFLGAEPLRRSRLIDDRAAVAAAGAVLEEMGVDVDPRAVVGDLSTAYRQLTEIAKALAQDARVLIMDEPTASLARQESEALFALIRRLAARGIAVVYISHRMEEVYRIADRITVLRDGTRLLTRPLSEITPEQIVEGIVGKALDGQPVHRRVDGAGLGAVLLQAHAVHAPPKVRDVSFTLHAGEVIGLAGLMGSGRSELARALFGIDEVTSGEISVRGRRADLSSPRKAIAAGLALIPEDRREQGLVLEHSVADNLLLPVLGELRRGPLLHARRTRERSADLVRRFAVKVADPARPVSLLSGGNQQKVVLAKWMGTDPDVLILDEPTAGIDIGTKNEIVTMIRTLAAAGKGVIVISSEYPELLAVSDRVLIIRDGTIAGEYSREQIADEEFLELAVQGATS